jgi:hypothetical protein
MDFWKSQEGAKAKTEVQERVDLKTPQVFDCDF